MIWKCVRKRQQIECLVSLSMVLSKFRFREELSFLILPSLQKALLICDSIQEHEQRTEGFIDIYSAFCCLSRSQFSNVTFHFSTKESTTKPNKPIPFSSPKKVKKTHLETLSEMISLSFNPNEERNKLYRYYETTEEYRKRRELEDSLEGNWHTSLFSLFPLSFQKTVFLLLLLNYRLSSSNSNNKNDNNNSTSLPFHLLSLVFQHLSRHLSFYLLS